MTEVVLRAGRDRSVRRRHPWVLSGSVERVVGPEEPEGLVRVLSAEGEVVAHGMLSPRSALRVRLVAFGKEPPGEGWLEERIAAAVARRARDPLLRDTDAVRLLNAEGDGLPGLVADRYADVVVVKLSTAGMAARRGAVAAALAAASGASAGYERADTFAARREGLAAEQGALWGSPPAAPVPIRERDRRYRVDVAAGQKTGFYLDQRDARALVARLAEGRRVLDCFAYTGGFAVAAARGGARSVVVVESSAAALAAAGQHLADNAPEVPAELVDTDAFRFLRSDERRFDLLVIDPPPLARKQHDVPRAARGYKDLLLQALRRAEPGARILFFACSHHVGPDLFRKIAFGASLDAGRPLRVLATLGAPSDHPVALDHPEGAYLSGLLLEA